MNGAQTLHRTPHASLWILSWGVLGVAVLLLQAIWRLTPVALEPIQRGQLDQGQIGFYVGWVLFNGYLEGYRAFQKRFSPRVVARALHLSRHPRPLHVVLAPLFCMSFFHTTRKGLIAAWIVTVAVMIAIVVVRMMPQPWRGIIDGGVVVGLAWGLAALLYYFVTALTGAEPSTSAEIPEPIAARAGE